MSAPTWHLTKVERTFELESAPVVEVEYTGNPYTGPRRERLAPTSIQVTEHMGPDGGSTIECPQAWHT